LHNTSILKREGLDITVAARQMHTQDKHTNMREKDNRSNISKNNTIPNNNISSSFLYVTPLGRLVTKQTMLILLLPTTFTNLSCCGAVQSVHLLTINLSKDDITTWNFHTSPTASTLEAAYTTKYYHNTLLHHIPLGSISLDSTPLDHTPPYNILLDYWTAHHWTTHH
jgi:hypothetical protein